MYCYSTDSIQLKIIVLLRRIDKFDKISADVALKMLALAVHFVHIIYNFPSIYLFAPTTLFSFGFEFSF